MLDLDTLLKAIPIAFPNHRIITTLGETANRTYAYAESTRTFYLLGAMGMTIPLATGLAIASPDPVLAIEGDGGLLMNLGGLTTVSRYATPNLAILIIDNDGYSTTGDQPTSFAFTSGIEAIASSCGINTVRHFSSPGSEGDALAWVAQPGLRIAIAHCRPHTSATPFVNLTPKEIAARFLED